MKGATNADWLWRGRGRAWCRNLFGGDFNRGRLLGGGIRHDLERVGGAMVTGVRVVNLEMSCYANVWNIRRPYLMNTSLLVGLNPSSQAIHLDYECSARFCIKRE